MWLKYCACVFVFLFIGAMVHHHVHAETPEDLGPSSSCLFECFRSGPLSSQQWLISPVAPPFDAPERQIPGRTCRRKNHLAKKCFINIYIFYYHEFFPSIHVVDHKVLCLNHVAWFVLQIVGYNSWGCPWRHISAALGFHKNLNP